MSEKVRLVAPAGNFQALKSAVIAGADAVYTGVDRFSARAFAQNFSLDELQEAVDFAHLHGCEVYVAMNTLVKNSELPDALSYLFSLQKIGVDAVVMQDIGLITLARLCMVDHADTSVNTPISVPILSSLPSFPSLPPLKIFASTQTTAHSIESVELLANMGVSRAILARELSLSEMQNIADYVKHHSGIGLEVFVHGALCISYSGQCLMSSFIGSRSGNRGRCSQPCRQKYALVNHARRLDLNHNPTGGTPRPPKPIRHLLSPRDMMLLDHVCNLIDAGITSFKIEGRMRRYEYVASAVFAYRQAIDACLADSDVADMLDAEKTKLEAVFTRGFTDYYLTGKGKLMQTKRPHNRGVCVGAVSDYNPRKSIAYITLTSPLRKGDGIRIESDLGDTGMLIREDATKNLSVRTDSPVVVGDAVFCTYDVRVMKSIVEMVDRPLSMDIHVKAYVDAGKPLVIELNDTDGNVAKATSDISAQRAEKKPMAQDAFEKQVLKFGDTPFDVESYDIHIGDDVFLPIKIINETRRHAVSALMAQRVGKSDEYDRMDGVEADDNGSGNDANESDYIKEKIEKCLSTSIQNLGECADRQTASKPSLIVSVHDFDCGVRAISQGADCIYLAWEGRKHLEKLSEYAKPHGIAVFLKTAHIIKDGDTLRKFLAGRKQIIDGIVAKNLTAVAIAKELDIPFVADYHLNVFNSIAMGTMYDMGAMRIVPSVELTLDDLKRLQGAPTECIVHGDVEVMVSESDILKIKGKDLDGGKGRDKDQNKGKAESKKKTVSDIGYTFGLVDEKGYEFPIFADEDGMTHVLNSKELCAISMLSGIIDAGMSGLRIDAEHMKPEYMETVVSYYRREIDEYLAKRKGYRFEIDRRKKLESLSPRGFTRGHYLRGVD